jgi:tripartite-type tricarboxylate transporter receptor subunit TctC
MMKFPRRQFLHLTTGAVALSAVSRIATAQTYPERPVRVIVPFPPGGATDVFARPVAQKLSEQLGKQFYVDNVGGASGNIGMGQAARAKPDGYTILFAFSSYVTNPSLFNKVPYDPYKDFQPVTLAVAAPTVLSVNPSVPAKTLQELVALIRANPGKYSFASGGVGTQPHLVGEQLRLSLALDLVHVPFSGGGPTVASLIAGHTPIGVNVVTPLVPHIKDGTLRALAVASKTRTQSLPDVPTMAEAGYPDIEGESWVGVLVPAGTPEPIITALHSAIVKILALPELKESLTALGYEVVASTPEEFAKRIKFEIETWGKVIRAANIKAE